MKAGKKDACKLEAVRKKNIGPIWETTKPMQYSCYHSMLCGQHLVNGSMEEMRSDD